MQKSKEADVYTQSYWKNTFLVYLLLNVCIVTINIVHKNHCPYFLNIVLTETLQLAT